MPVGCICINIVRKFAEHNNNNSTHIWCSYKLFAMAIILIWISIYTIYVIYMYSHAHVLNHDNAIQFINPLTLHSCFSLYLYGKVSSSIKWIMTVELIHTIIVIVIISIIFHRAPMAERFKPHAHHDIRVYWENYH